MGSKSQTPEDRHCENKPWRVEDPFYVDFEIRSAGERIILYALDADRAHNKAEDMLADHATITYVTHVDEE